MKLQGKIKVIYDTKQLTETFKARQVVITTPDENYPQDIIIQFIQDRCDFLNDFQVGDVVDIDINIRGKEWTNDKGEVKYINTIQGWRIEKSIANEPVVENVNPVVDTQSQAEYPF